ncbi:X-linked retinitis pigmentosa GTPase regulator [Melanotaenia boesemani]|uniref:X-linked retinitis pigmentosa GTPase regulator n=1 Tax=Melanotaenia boesemani TaxID=1250792 RepID=UPI001C05057D|nr:X-linked retinitis pigmentosa GTPase regulator [Melanotaenia boesemani]
MTGQTEADIPETGAIFTFGKSSFSDNVPSKFWLKNDHPAHISCGREHSAVITENGRLLMFGGNTCGQLGFRLKPAANKPSSVKALKSEKVKLVACGRDHTIVCTFLGNVYGAGNNQEGQLGLGHCKNTRTFQLLPSFCERAQMKMLSAGCSTSAALTEDGRLFMWGDNSVGQIGLGDKLCATEPKEVNIGEAVTWVSCGDHHSAFVTVHGGLYTFGEIANGRLGLPAEQLANHKVPQRVQGILGRVTQVCCGGQHTVALTGEDVHTFGCGRYGQLGHGTFQFELCLPEPLKHFHHSSIRHIACGENHTAVVTKSGLLYTFGDGRYGKLGLGDENFINQFSPTLCTRFLPYSVQSVSCGSQHMLVLAAPRPPGSQDVELDKDVIITDYLMESNYDEILLKDSLIYPAPVVPFSALAARARHREKKSSVELFGRKFHNLPHLNSGFLNTSWQTSRNIQTQKKLSRDVATPTSSPKPQSEATASPLLFPRSQSISPHSVAVSSKSSRPQSQSSYSRQSKASTTGSSKSKSKMLPHLLSPKSITKYKPSSPASIKETAKIRRYQAAATRKALSNKLSSPLPPKAPCSPTRPLNKNLSDGEHPASPQTEREALEKQLVPQDVEDREVEAVFLPYTEGEQGTRTAKGEEAYAEHIQSDGNTSQNSPKALPTELLTGSSSIKTEVKRKENKQITSKGQGSITMDSGKTKKLENRKVQKELSSFKSAKHDKSKQSEYSPKIQQSIQKTKTEVKKHARKNMEESKRSKDNATDNSNKDLVGTTERVKMISSAFDRTTPVLKIANGNETTSSISTENSSKDDTIIQANNAEIKPFEVEVQQETQSVKSTPGKVKKKVKSASAKGQSRPVVVKPPPVKKETTPVITLSQFETKKSSSVKSTPVKVKGNPRKMKTKPDKDQRAENPSPDSKSIKKGEENEVISIKDIAQETNSTTANKQGLQAKEKKRVEESETKLRSKTKLDKEEKDIKTKSDSDDNLKHNIRAKLKKKVKASGSLSSQDDKSPEPLCDAISLQSPNRTDVFSVSGVKSMQSSEPVGMDLIESEANREEAKEEKPRWKEILSDPASLLPAVGMATAAIGLLSEAVTNVEGFQSDSDKITSAQPETPLKARQFTKQKAVMQPSFSSTLSHFTSNEMEDNTQEEAQVSILSESENSSQLKDCDDSTHDTADQEAVKSVTSEQVTSQGLDTSQNDDGENDEKSFNSEEDVDGKKDKTNTDDDEEGESGSDVENSDSNEGSESISGTEAVLKNDSGEDDEDQDNKSEEEEKTDSNSEEEDEGTDKSDAAEAEGEEEESKMETDEGSSDSEVSEAAEEEEEGESKASTEEESKEEEEDSEVSESEEEESSDESEDADSKSEDSEEEEEDGEGSDSAESAQDEKTESDEEEEDETEEQKDDDSPESEDEEKDSEEESKGEEDSDAKDGSQEEEEGETSDQENEEEGEEDESADGTEAENEFTEDEEEEEGEGEGDTTDDEEVEEKNEENAEEEGEDEEGESEGEEAAKNVITESSNEEEDEEEYGNKDTKMRQNNQDEQSESKNGPEDEESDDEEYEEETNEGEDEENKEKGMDSEVEDGEDEDEEGGEEEDQEGDEKKEEEEEGDEEEGNAEEEHQDENKEEEEEEVEEEGNEEEEEEEEQGDEGEDDEQEGNEEEERDDEKEEEEEEVEEEGNEEEEEEEEQGDEGDEEEQEEDEEQEDEEEEDEKGEEEEEEEEEEEGDEEEEEEEEREKLKSTKKRKEERQKLPAAAAPSDRKDRHQREAPKPAPRTKRRPAGQNTEDGSQQFWNNVLPQYLDLQ